MTDCKLPQLPDRTPVRINILLRPEQHRRLLEYAAFYRATYGREEAVGELIPAMLAAFMDSDRGFSRCRASG